MVVLPLAILASLMLGAAAGGDIRNLEGLRLRGEALFLFMLAVQVLLPLLRLRGLYADLAYAVWFATFPVMILVCVLNHRTRGMLVAAAGLALNMAVIGANHGMPVSAEAAGAISSAPLVIKPGDFVHVLMTEATRLGLLADVLPFPGPEGIRSLLSAGDVLLVCGVGGVAMAAMCQRAGPARGDQDGACGGRLH